MLVLTGTATLFSAETLRHVVRARAEGLLPGRADQVYDTNVLTEDNELTLALLHLGYNVVSPKGCRLTTEVMDVVARPLPAAAALEARRDREPPRLRPDAVTAQYWRRQLFTFVGIARDASPTCCRSACRSR